jgi:cobalamin biosynthesis protein CobT
LYQTKVQEKKIISFMKLYTSQAVMARTKQTARKAPTSEERKRKLEIQAENQRLERLAEESDAKKRKSGGEGLGSGEESGVEKSKREGDEEATDEYEEEEEEKKKEEDEAEDEVEKVETPCVFQAYIQNHPVYNPLFPHMPSHITPNMLRKSDRTAKYWIRAFKDVKLRPLAAACVAHVQYTDCYV